jgi:hypothetical protein
VTRPPIRRRQIALECASHDTIRPWCRTHLAPVHGSYHQPPGHERTCPNKKSRIRLGVATLDLNERNCIVSRTETTLVSQDGAIDARRGGTLRNWLLLTRRHDKNSGGGQDEGENTALHIYTMGYSSPFKEPFLPLIQDRHYSQKISYKAVSSISHLPYHIHIALAKPPSGY